MSGQRRKETIEWGAETIPGGGQEPEPELPRSKARKEYPPMTKRADASRFMERRRAR